MLRISELIASGASEAEIRGVRKQFQRVRKGVYVESGLAPLQFHMVRCAAVLAAVSERAVLSGPSAAVVRGLPLVGAPTAVVYLRGLPRGRYGHDVKILGADAPGAEVHGGMRVAGADIMVADCCRVLCGRDALIIADAAAHQGLVSRRSLAATAAARAGTAGIRTLRWVAAGVDALCESPGETWTRIVLTELGYTVRSQFVVRDADFTARLDFLIEGSRVVVEFDGAVKYSGPEAFQSEKNRQARLEMLGYRLIRVTWEQLADPVALARRIRWALES